TVRQPRRCSLGTKAGPGNTPAAAPAFLLPRKPRRSSAGKERPAVLGLRRPTRHELLYPRSGAPRTVAPRAGCRPRDQSAEQTRGSETTAPACRFHSIPPANLRSNATGPAPTGHPGPGDAPTKDV